MDAVGSVRQAVTLVNILSHARQHTHHNYIILHYQTAAHFYMQYG